MRLGYIKDGVYHDDDDATPTLDSQASTFKQYDHEMQRQDHQWELLQPRKPNGQTNPEFVEAYPEEAKQYGMVNEDDE